MAVGPSAISKKADVWLVRLSYIAQIAGVILALMGLFYTVIPLYQKAAVDEQLARSEAELKELEKGLVIARRETYELRRDRRMISFLFSADDCSELRKVIGQISMEIPKEKRHELILSFDVNITDCLMQKIESMRAEGALLHEDIAVLEKNATTVGGKLMTDRDVIIRRIQDLPNAALQNPSLLEPPGESVRKMNEIVDRWEERLPPEFRANRTDRTEQRLKAQIAWNQEQIAQNFRVSASRKIREDIVPSSWRNIRLTEAKDNKK